MSGYIYGLADPRTLEIRYVGRTVASPYGRRRAHMNQALIENKATHNSAWIRSLARDGVAPMLVIIEQDVPLDVIDDHERWWVQSGRTWGWDLTNATRGGEGALRWSADSRLNLSHAMKGKKRSAEAVAKTAAAHRGTKRSAETKRRISEARKGQKPPPRSEEHKLNLSEAAKRRWARQRGEVVV